MFKKGHNQKTAAPLRSSERRKLRSQVISQFLPQGASSEDADLLVPEGLLSAKFTTHLDEPGVVYFSPDGDPLWFTFGKGSTALVPTVYALWKRPLLPILTTPSAVIPKLIGGADLMIPGVIEISEGTLPCLLQDDLVAVAESPSAVPLAVGMMALSSSHLTADMKGKAVLVLHTWEDSLWDNGSKSEPPDSVPSFVPEEHGVGSSPPTTDDTIPKIDFPLESQAADGASTTQPLDAYALSSVQDLTPSDVDDILRLAILQSIKTQLSSLPLSSFPISSSQFYSAYILPSRPASAPSFADIKKSSYKKLSKFLQQYEKQGVLKLKDVKGGDVVITGVNELHTDVISHRKFKTIGSVEKVEAKKVKDAADEAAKIKPMEIVELWKPHGQSITLFELLQKSIKELYAIGELRSTLNQYVTSNSLIHPREPEYIKLDGPLTSTLLKKNETLDFIRRDEVIQRLEDVMQAWYRLTVDGKDPITKKGRLSPITVVVKIRQGRKASTLITNFEDFSITAEFLSEELRKICASATSVSPVQGKPSKNEVLVQGKQIKAVTDLLLAQGVPKRWIETADLSDKTK